MELKEAKYLDSLLRRANRSVINIDNVDGESIDTLIERDLIEVVDKRHGVDPYLIKISPRGRDFLASGGFEAEVNSIVIERKIRQKQYTKEKEENNRKKKEDDKNRRREIRNEVYQIIGTIAGIVAILGTLSGILRMK